MCYFNTKKCWLLIQNINKLQFIQYCNLCNINKFILAHSLKKGEPEIPISRFIVDVLVDNKICLEVKHTHAIGKDKRKECLQPSLLW